MAVKRRTFAGMNGLSLIQSDLSVGVSMKVLNKLYILMFTVFFITASLLSIQVYAGDEWWKSITKQLETKDETIAGELSIGEMGDAFKQALQIGSENVVNQLGGVDGFNGDASIHIPLPDEMDMVRGMLDKVGMSAMVDDLELKLNRAAEAATPKAKALFVQSISEMTFDDVKTIYEGPQDSATQYFKSKMSQSLATEMEPIVKETLASVGAVQAYDSVMGKYQSMPFVPDVKADLTSHVVEKGMEGIFYYIAKEEAAIRQDPMKQTTELLQKVFGVN